VGQKQTLQGMVGRTDFPPLILFILLVTTVGFVVTAAR